MRNLFGSLLTKIGLATIIIQLMVMSLLGIYYIGRFSDAAVQRADAQVQLPGTLMDTGLLSYEAVSHQDAMVKVVGGEVQDAMVIGFNHIIFQSLNSDDIGKDVTTIERLDSGLFTGDPDERVLVHDKDARGNYVASLTPIHSALGSAPFLFAYVRAGTDDLEHEKTNLRLLFLFGSIAAALLASGVVVALEIIVLSGIQKLTKAAQAIGSGRLDEEVVKNLPPPSNDEIGLLSSTFAKMTVELNRSREQLLNQINELERINRITVGRELKMVELKEKLKEEGVQEK